MGLSRVCWHYRKAMSGSQINVSRKRWIRLFCPHGNLLELFQFTEEIFNQMPLLIHLLVTLARGALRLLHGGITTLLPRFVKSLTSQSASNDLSASSAPNSLSLIKGSTPQMSWRCPGSRRNPTRFPKASNKASILVIMPPLALVMGPPLPPDRGGGLWRCCHQSWHIPYPVYRWFPQRSW